MGSLRRQSRARPPVRRRCPECDTILGGPRISNARALEKLRRHRLDRHGKGSAKSMPRAVEGPRGTPVIPAIGSSLAHVATRAVTTCPECSVAVREDRLQRHLRRVHRKEGATGKFRINDLARELGVKSKSILIFLAKLGHEF